MRKGEARLMGEDLSLLESNILPPDGKVIWVSHWRQQLVLTYFVVFALLFLGIAIRAFAIGSTGYLLGMGALAWGAWSIRIPLTGLILEPQGIKVRTPLWTYQYSWQEVKSFELVERPISPYAQRFRIHLSAGRVRKVRGFFARGSDEEERRQEMMKALEARLAQEHER